MPQQFLDQARAILQGNIVAAATSLSITASVADRFPVGNTSSWGTPLNWFKCVLIDNTGQFEVIKVGVRASGSGAFSNVLRAQDGTTAKNFTAGVTSVIHGPLAADFALALAGIFAYLSARDSGDPKLEISKTGSGAAAALFHMVAGKLTIAQSDGAGGVTADRITIDQTNGNITTAGTVSMGDLAITSDERAKSKFKPLPEFFLQMMADVKRGLYRRRGHKRLEAGVSAQSLEEVAPWWVQTDEKGAKSVNYAQAALVTAIESAAAVGQMQAELVDLRARLARLERA